MTQRYILWVTAVLFAVVAQAHGFEPAGDDFAVNTYTTGEQSFFFEPQPTRRRAASMASNGEFIIVWHNKYVLGGSDSDVFGRRYSADGTPLTGEFQLNSYTTEYQGSAAVGRAPDDSFVVVWSSYYRGVAVQRFDAGASPMGTEFVAAGTAHYLPTVAVNSSNNFMVVWGEDDGSSRGVAGRVFDSTGSPLGTAFVVNSYTTGYQLGASVSALSGDGFAVTWEGAFNQDGSSGGVFARVFDSSGTPLGPDFQVNSFTTGYQGYSESAAMTDGTFVVVWESAQDGTLASIFAQRFSSTGTKIGTEFRVNSYTTGGQYYSAIGKDAAGGFLVVWSGDPGGSSFGALHGQRVDASGVALGTQFQVNTYTALSGFRASVGGDGAGNFVVAWEYYDGDQYGIRARVFRSEPDADADGVADADDSCSSVANPDQLNSDCPDATFFTSGGCTGSVPSSYAGCCDGGDLCDSCPAVADHSQCNQQRSVSQTIGPEGGLVQTQEVNGTISASVLVPPGALDAPTSVSLTETLTDADFVLRKPQAAVALSISARPEGQSFNEPVTVTFRWDDRDKDGKVDLGLCEGGASAGLPCSTDAICEPGGQCSRTAAPNELDLILKHNNDKFSKDGLNVSPYKCSDHLKGTCSGNTSVACAEQADCDAVAAGTCNLTAGACNSSSADCNGAAAQRTVAQCCDPTDGPSDNLLYGEWMFQTCDFSELYLGLTAGDLPPGKGSPKTDCIVEWQINVPLNDPYLDKKGLVTFKQSCRDGDPVCDTDGVANGECSFAVGVCANVEDPRLVKKGEVQCQPSDLATWRLVKPRIGSEDPVEVQNAAFLLLSMLGLAPATQPEPDEVAYTSAVAEVDECSVHVPVRVPLGGPNMDKKGKLTIVARAETSPPPGKNRGTKDTDKLKLTCLP